MTFLEWYRSSIYAPFPELQEPLHIAWEASRIEHTREFDGTIGSVAQLAYRQGYRTRTEEVRGFLDMEGSVDGTS